MSLQSPPNIVWHNPTVTRERRQAMNGHRACVLWFTGLSGAGKSTLAHAVEEMLHRAGCRTFVLDGDTVRHGLSSNLGFSDDDRKRPAKYILPPFLRRPDDGTESSGRGGASWVGGSAVEASGRGWWPVGRVAA